MREKQPTQAELRRSSISVETAARLTGYSASQIRRALQRGDLEGYRAGARGRFQIPDDAIEQWIRPARTEESPP
jgi:excisionase family DNA binding protein